MAPERRTSLERFLQRRVCDGAIQLSTSIPGLEVRVQALRALVPRCAEFSPARYSEAMSQGNVEIVRAFFGAWNAGNTDAVVELLDADVDYFPLRKLPEARPCHGPKEVLQFIARYLDAYSRHEWAIQEVIEVGGDRFLVRVNLRIEGRDSGMKLEGDLYHCFWLRDGRFFRVEDHMTLSGALHALGLEGGTLEAVGL